MGKWMDTVPPFGYCSCQEVGASFTAACPLVQIPLLATVRKGKGGFAKCSGYVLNILRCHHWLWWFLVVLEICFPSPPETGQRSCSPQC